MKYPLAIAILLFAASAAAQIPALGGDPASRAIKTMSAEEIDALRHGRARGLSMAAELNGIPGPARLLEMKAQIPLTLDQTVVAEFELKDVTRHSKSLGGRLIVLERALNEGLSTGKLTERGLRAQLRKIAEIRRRLDYLHLSAHLRMRAMLSDAQFARYRQLRKAATQAPAPGEPVAAPANTGCASGPAASDPNCGRPDPASTGEPATLKAPAAGATVP